MMFVKLSIYKLKNLKKIYNKTFNIGGGLKNSISLKDLSKKCEKITKNKIRINKVPKTSSYDIPYYVSDNTKVSKFYKWKSYKNINQILNDIYLWLSKEKFIKKYFK